jgi:hypothetical protein
MYVVMLELMETILLQREKCVAILIHLISCRKRKQKGGQQEGEKCRLIKIADGKARNEMGLH